MGKPEMKIRKKDKFFVKKTSKNKITKPSNNSPGSFFVTSSEKEKTVNEKLERNSKWQVQSEKIQEKPKPDRTKSKKPFDKKKWRMKKYSKKYKLEQWENKRKKVVLQEYYKQVNDDEPKFDVQKIYEKYGEEDENDNNFNKDLQGSNGKVENNDDQVVEEVRSEVPKKKNKAFKKAHEEFHRIKEDNKKRKEEIAQEKVERAEAKKQYKAQKLDKFKKLNKKTKKGQPIMKYRMEMLLEQIQKSMP